MQQPGNLVGGREAGRDRASCVRGECLHPGVGGEAPERCGGGPVRDLVPDFVRDGEELIDTRAPSDAIAAPGAASTAARSAGLPDESLGDDPGQPPGNQEGGHAHVEEARHCSGRIRGVDRGEDEMPGYGSGHRDLGCLPISDLPDHDDIRILAKHRPQRGRKPQTRPTIDADLTRAGESILHRVLEGDDVQLLTVNLGECGEERRALPASGRSGGEYDAFAASQKGASDGA